MASFRALVPAVLSVIVSACAQAPAPTSPEGSSALTIVGLSPAANGVLSAGATVTLSLTVVSNVAGRLSLSVHDQAGVALLPAEPTLDLQAGHEASLGTPLVVPTAATSVVLRGDFRPATTYGTPTVVFARYSVR